MNGSAAVFGADEQAEVPVDVARWVGLARLVLDIEPAATDGEVSLVFVDEAAITDLNGRFLDREGPTDVLAFPMDEETVPGGRRPDQGGRGPGVPADPGEPPLLLGDVVICPAVARRQADERGVAIDDELALLVVHGVLHLLNYEHYEPSEAADMERRQDEILRRYRQIEEGG